MGNQWNLAKAKILALLYPSVKTDGNEFDITCNTFNSLPSLLSDGGNVNKRQRALAKISDKLYRMPFQQPN